MNAESRNPIMNKSKAAISVRMITCTSSDRIRSADDHCLQRFAILYH